MFNWEDLKQMDARELEMWHRQARSKQIVNKMSHVHDLRLAQAEKNAYKREMNRLKNDLRVVRGETTRQKIHQEGLANLEMLAKKG